MSRPAAPAQTYDQIAFSVDLVEACRRELDFLVDVDGHRSLTGRGPVVRRAIRRYEECWLPLAARHQSTAPAKSRSALAPAVDVHWIWHCHMLAPYSYQSDVTRLVGRVVDHRLMTRGELEQARSRTRALWNAAYPHEPFDVDLGSADELLQCLDDGDAGADATADYASQCGYDIEAAVERQSKFYYQVC